MSDTSSLSKWIEILNALNEIHDFIENKGQSVPIKNEEFEDFKNTIIGIESFSRAINSVMSESLKLMGGEVIDEDSLYDIAVTYNKDNDYKGEWLMYPKEQSLKMKSFQMTFNKA